MKKIRSCTAYVLALAGLFAALQAAPASNSTAKTAAKGSSASAATNAAAANAAPVELTIPVSVFNLTNKVVKDPFFPNTLRTPVPVIVLQSNTFTVSASCFALKAIAGTPDQRLALINNRTVAVGEPVEISTPQCGKLKIVCTQIKDVSVVIRISNLPDPVEIFLPKSAQ